jgi:dTDP-4-dehydrorhamnose reductase
MNGKILILGKNGQVGSALVDMLGTQALAANRENVDLLNHDFISQLEQWINGSPLSAVINAAAYTQVDKAEGEGREAAFAVNATAVAQLAAWCKDQGLPLVHYSTDYVFNGGGDEPHLEGEQPAPLNVYGESKLAGENAIKAQGDDYIILRTSWVYNARGKNFFNTILRLMKEKDSLNVVADQMGAPTYAPHLAAAALEALRQHAFGIYHVCNSGVTSWHGFAQAIFALATTYDSSIKCKHINPIPTSAYPLPAPRPLNSRLDCTKAAELLGIALPSWEEGLRECIEEKYAGSELRDSGSQNHPAQNSGR